MALAHAIIVARGERRKLPVPCATRAERDQSTPRAATLSGRGGRVGGLGGTAAIYVNFTPRRRFSVTGTGRIGGTIPLAIPIKSQEQSDADRKSRRAEMISAKLQIIRVPGSWLYELALDKCRVEFRPTKKLLRTDRAISRTLVSRALCSDRGGSRDLARHPCRKCARNVRL